MKHVMVVLGVVLIAALLLGVGLLRAQDAEKAETAPAPGAAPFKSDMKQVSYCIGVNVGRSFKAQDVALDVDAFLDGFRDGLGGKEPRISQPDMQKIMMAYQQELVAHQKEKTKRMTEENRTKGAAFLAENGKKEGVKVTDTGLQYKVLKEGAGKRPQATDTVTVHYKGTLIDGTEFDSSYGRGEPVTFPVRGVIRGWTEALLLMKEGARWQVVIPSELAYGERGAGRDIGPNAVLVFEIELIRIGGEK